MADNRISLDLSGLKCPLPALFLERALKGASAGAVFVVRATDPMAEVDLPYSAQKLGAQVLSVETVDGGVKMVVQK